MSFFAQIYKFQRYGQYKMHGSVINVLANVNQTQYYHIYHMMMQQYVCFLSDILNINHLIC
jgi:hypothetical protein